MARHGMYRGWIGFFTERNDSGSKVSEVRWVKGNTQPYKKSGTVVDITGGFIEIKEVGGRVVYTKQNPFPEATSPDYFVYFIDPANGLPYRVESEANWNTYAGRSPKHYEFKGSREMALSFPNTPNTTPTANSVADYESKVASLKVLVNTFFN